MNSEDVRAKIKIITEFESKDELYNFKFQHTNLAMWYFVRYEIYHEVLFDTSNQINLKKNVTVTKRYLSSYIYHNLFFSTNKNIVYVGFYDNSMKADNEGYLSYNPIKGYVNLIKRTTVLIPEVTGICHEQKIYYKNWKSEKCLDELAFYKAEDNKKDTETIKKFISYLKEKFPYKLGKYILRLVHDRLIPISKCYRSYEKYWEIYLKLVKPKFVVVGWGFYASLGRSSCIMACKKLKIPTGEIQHGYVGEFHMNYNYCNRLMVDDSFKSISPDYFLTLGDYWKRYINVPAKIVNIGTYKRYVKNPDKNENYILVCVTSMQPDMLEELLECLSARITGKEKIFLRMHPLVDIKQYEKSIQNTNVILANDLEIEYYLNICRYLITEGSTVIYEALTCGCVVFAYKGILYYREEFDKIEDRLVTFGNIKELDEKWQNRKKFQAKCYDDFYSLDYKKRYINFMNQFIK
jgi:hypothetical protein